MKHHTLRNSMARAWAIGERYLGPLRGFSEPRRATVYQEMNLGAGVGLTVSAASACAAGVPAVVLLAAALLGFCVGAVIGLLLWSSSTDLPTDPVMPPAPGQERHKRPAAHRPAATLTPG